MNPLVYGVVALYSVDQKIENETKMIEKKSTVFASSCPFSFLITLFFLLCFNCFNAFSHRHRRVSVASTTWLGFPLVNGRSRRVYGTFLPRFLTRVFLSPSARRPDGQARRFPRRVLRRRWLSCDTATQLDHCRTFDGG